jgi:hypothetical protein
LCAAADASSLPRHPQASAFGSKRLPSPGTTILAGAVFLVAAQLLRRAVAVSTTDTNQSDPCAIAHDQSQLWRGQTPGPGAAVIDFSSLNEGHGRRHIASARHLLAFCIAFRCVEGQCLQSLNRPRRDERGGRCDGAFSRLSSGCRRRCAVRWAQSIPASRSHTRPSSTLIPDRGQFERGRPAERRAGRPHGFQ